MVKTAFRCFGRLPFCPLLSPRCHSFGQARRPRPYGCQDPRWGRACASSLFRFFRVGSLSARRCMARCGGTGVLPGSERIRDSFAPLGMLPPLFPITAFPWPASAQMMQKSYRLAGWSAVCMSTGHRLQSGGGLSGKQRRVGHRPACLPICQPARRPVDRSSSAAAQRHGRGWLA